MEENAEYCLNCGAPRENSAKFCYNCSHIQEDSFVRTNSRAREILIGIVITIVIDIAVGILLILLAYLMTSGLLSLLANLVILIGVFQYVYILPIIYHLEEKYYNISRGVLWGSLLVLFINILVMKSFK